VRLGVLPKVGREAYHGAKYVVTFNRGLEVPMIELGAAGLMWMTVPKNMMEGETA